MAVYRTAPATPGPLNIKEDKYGDDYCSGDNNASRATVPLVNC